MNYLALLGWSPRGDEEIVPAFDVDRAVPLGGRLALAGVLRREEAAPHERRVHTGALARGVHSASAPWVRPWDSDWRPSGLEPAWRERPVLGRALRKVAPLVQERVATLGEIPDDGGVLLPRRASLRRGELRQGHHERSRRPRDPRRSDRALRAPGRLGARRRCTRSSSSSATSSNFLCARRRRRCAVPSPARWSGHRSLSRSST